MTDPKPHGGRSALARHVVLAAVGGLVLVGAGSVAADRGWLPGWLIGNAPQAATSAPDDMFRPPEVADIPNDENGAAIRRGMEIFINTPTAAGDHVGNALSCANCHLDAGRQPFSAPMWAAWVTYPKYRAKNHAINTMTDRIKGCFTYSMNAQWSKSGKAPDDTSDIYRDLEAYFFWLAKGLPTDEVPRGTGFGKIDAPPLPFDRIRGKQVFADNCAVCHGADGQGQKDLNGRVIFPPLWGPHSYNWGAGMASLSNAAPFILRNMPLSKPGSLTVQEAWDVAAWIDSQPRPKDPRQTGTVAEAMKAHHGSKLDFYGREVDGYLLGTGVPEPAAE